MDKSSQSESSTGQTLEYGEDIDQSTFEQILEMDDEPGQEFSRGIVYGFFEQADATIKSMEQNLEHRDLEQLSQLGHFLKGSSATLGLTKVKESCEKIQNYGSNKDESGTEPEPDDDVCLDRIRKTLPVLTKDYEKVEKMLRDYYEPPKRDRS